MGNNRKVTEANLVKNLNMRIGEAKAVLGKLAQEEKELEEKTLTAQKKLESSVAELEAELQKTKEKLLNEIGKKSLSNRRQIKERIMTTCGTLGSLENMLCQLDKFDQGQLLTVKIPELKSEWEFKETDIIDSSFDPSGLKKAKGEIYQWGETVMDQTGFSRLKTQIATDFDTISKMMIEMKNDFGKRKHPIQSSESDNDFLFTYKRKLESPTWNADELFPPFTSNEFNWVVPTKKTMALVNQEDLSLWLKPQTNNLDFEKNFESLSLKAEMTEKKVENVEKILDFPCLAHDANYWMKRKNTDEPSEKKAKREEEEKENEENVKPQNSETFVERRSFFNEENDFEFIPPSYALPDPFWLKKYC